MLEVFFDGLCIPNDRSGIPCYGFLIKKDGQVIHSDKGVAAKPFSDEATNNVAEYTALIKALEWLKENGCASLVPEGEIDSPLFRTAESAQDSSGNNNIGSPGNNIVIKGDSALVINQLTGKFKIKTKRIRPLYKKTMSLLAQFYAPKIIWIPREENAEADRLSKVAYKEARKTIPLQ
jgi:ribonuclease HI